MSKITEELKNQIFQLYTNDKLSAEKIGSIVNMSRGKIYWILKGMNTSFRPVKKINLIDIEKHANTRELDYFIGILATDGCVTGGVVALEFAQQDAEILIHWNDFLGNKCNITTHTKKSTGSVYYKIAFMNRDICKYLGNYGIVPRKSLILKLSYINWDILRGAFEGDGSLIYDHRHRVSAKFRIASGSVAFLTQIKEFLESEGIKATIYAEKNSNTSILNVGIASDIYKIYCNIYKNATYFLMRKYLKFGPLVKKFSSNHSVNSGDEVGASNPEPSFNRNIIEGAETRNGEPKQITNLHG